MKILLVQNAIYIPAYSGASKANRSLIEGLAEKGHSCRAIVPQSSLQKPLTQEQFREELVKQDMMISFCSQDVTCFQHKGVEVHAVASSIQLSVYVKKHVYAFQPDWIVVASEDPGQVLLEAALDAYPGRVISLVHSALVLPFGPRSFAENPARANLFRRVAGILTVSNYLREYIWRWGELQASVISFPAYGSGPFPRFENFGTGSITMINPCAIKGIDIFLALARSMPTVPFAAVASWGTTQADRAALVQLSNMEILETTEHIDEIFAQMRMLLVPSLWDEAFGMIVVEAMLRGIPVLASNVGGLAEAKLGVDYVLPVHPIEQYEARFDSQVLPVPVVPAQNVIPWYEAVHHLLTDQAHYEHLARTSRDAALKYVSHLTIDAFEQFFANLASNTTYAVKGDELLTREQEVRSNGVKDTLAGLSPERRALLAQRLKRKEQQKHTSTQENITGASRVGEHPAFPLSFAQQRLWFLYQLAPGSSAYNGVSVYRVSGLLNAEIFKRSLQKMVSRHESLRTTFVMEQDQPVQVINSTLSLPLIVIDLQEISESIREKEIQRLANQEVQYSFSLACGPLFHIVLLRQSTERHIVLLNMHHIISDGLSMRIFWQDVVKLYEALRRDAPPPLPELPIQYADYALWQRQQMQGKILEDHLAYWKRQLAEAPPALALPFDSPDSASPVARGTAQSIQLSEKLTQALRVRSQRESTTMFMMLLTVLKLLLFKWTNQNDIIVGTTVAERSEQETERLIGCFINFLALRSVLSEEMRGKELLAQVKSAVLDAYAHQACPFEKIVEAVKPDRKLYQNPLYNVAFLLQDFTFESFSDSTGLLECVPDISVISTGVRHAALDMRFIVDEVGPELVFTCEYNSDLFEAATIGQLIKSYRELLSQFVQEPDRKLSQFKISQDLEARARRARERQQAPSIAIAATFTAEPLEEALAFWMQELALPHRIEFAPYNQLFQQLLDPQSLLATNQKGINVILLRLEDWMRNGEYAQATISSAASDTFQHYKLPNYMTIAHINSYETDYLYQEIFENRVYMKHGIMLDEDSYIFDVGANIGMFTLFAQQECRNARIFAFEPSPPVYEILRYNASLFGSNVLVFNYGLSEEAKTASFTFYPRSSVFSGYHADRAQDKQAIKSVILAQQQGVSDDATLLDHYTDELAEGRVEKQTFLCPMRTLSSVIQEQKIERIDLLKIDVEKSELAVLRGIQEEDWKKIKQIVIEVHDADGEMLRCVVALLEQHGYQLVVEQEDVLKEARFHNIYARRPSTECIQGGQKEQAISHQSMEEQEEQTAARQRLQHCARDLLAALETSMQRSPCPFLLAFCPASPALQARPHLWQVHQQVLHELTGQLASCPQVVLLDVPQLLRRYQVEHLHDPLTERAAHIPYRQQVYTVLATAIACQVAACQRPSSQKQREQLRRTLKWITEELDEEEQIQRAITNRRRENRRREQGEWIAPQTPLESMISEIWGQVLGVERVGRHDNFFDLGGHSLLLIRVYSKLQEQLKREIAVVDLFAYPTVSALAHYLSGGQEDLLTAGITTWAKKRTELLKKQRKSRSTEAV
jgi:FkbM family methyltransferase